MALPKSPGKTQFTGPIISGKTTGDPTTQYLGSVILNQNLGTVVSTDTVATAKAVVPNGSDIHAFTFDVTTAFEASAAANLEIKAGGQVLGTFGVSALGRYSIAPTGANAASWYAVSAASTMNVCSITVRVTANTVPSGGTGLLRMTYIQH